MSNCKPTFAPPCIHIFNYYVVHWKLICQLYLNTLKSNNNNKTKTFELKKSKG